MKMLIFFMDWNVVIQTTTATLEIGAFMIAFCGWSFKMVATITGPQKIFL